jgi:hypothetical protein
VPIFIFGGVTPLAWHDGLVSERSKNKLQIFTMLRHFQKTQGVFNLYSYLEENSRKLSIDNFALSVYLLNNINFFLARNFKRGDGPWPASWPLFWPGEGSTS